MPHGATRGRGGVNRFRQRAEGHAPRFQIVQEADQIPQRPPQPAQLPNDKCIILYQALRHFVNSGRLTCALVAVNSRVHPASKAASCKSGFWSPVETRANRDLWPSFVPDLWHNQLIDLSGTETCVKTFHLWHNDYGLVGELRN